MKPPDAYKGYYLMTSRCNLDCSYCVLEDAPEQLGRELDLDGKKALIAHLHRIGFRHLTLSGGEVLLIGKRPPRDFLELLAFLRTFRSEDPTRHLGVALYTNGTRLDAEVADAMVGVVDEVSVTIDSSDDGLLQSIGRNTGRHQGYFERAAAACGLLTQRGIQVKLHTVVAQMNHERIAIEAPSILDAVEAAGGTVGRWKFYQYMSYDDAARDGAHAIPAQQFAAARDGVTRALAGRQVQLHFKDNEEMTDSLFNILPYGNAQYLAAGDSWSTSRRTRDLRSYATMDELFAEQAIDVAAFRRFHTFAQGPGEAGKP